MCESSPDLLLLLLLMWCLLPVAFVYWLVFVLLLNTNLDVWNSHVSVVNCISPDVNDWTNSSKCSAPTFIYQEC